METGRDRRGREGGGDMGRSVREEGALSRERERDGSLDAAPPHPPAEKNHKKSRPRSPEPVRPDRHGHIGHDARAQRGHGPRERPARGDRARAGHADLLERRRRRRRGAVVVAVWRRRDTRSGTAAAALIGPARRGGRGHQAQGRAADHRHPLHRGRRRFAQANAGLSRHEKREGGRRVGGRRTRKGSVVAMSGVPLLSVRVRAREGALSSGARASIRCWDPARKKRREAEFTGGAFGANRTPRV